MCVALTQDGKSRCNPRECAEADAKVCHEAFKNLGFNVLQYKNKTEAEYKKILSDGKHICYT